MTFSEFMVQTAWLAAQLGFATILVGAFMGACMALIGILSGSYHD